ncbi:MAG TPA: MCE family protein [Streptosporangiaceae bacterium]|nr:MCE family protein [Streptosporangiaceae bacterium]
MSPRGRRGRRGGLSITGLRSLLSRPEEAWPERPDPPPATPEAEAGSTGGPAAGARPAGAQSAGAQSAAGEPEAARPGRAAAALAPAYGYWRQRPALRWASLTVAVLVVAGLWLGYSLTHQGKQITAYFSQTIGVYAGSDVRILGVQVGTVNSVQPAGGQVKVTMTIDHGISVPAGARAVVVSPSVVADRYVQLTPAYTGGRQMASGAVIPVSRTATPVEVDELYNSLNKLAVALGPHGANAHDALSDLIKTGAANLNGNGKALADMISQFGQAMGTLGGSAGNLSATIDHLQLFTSMLKSNDGQVRQAEQQLAQVSGYLAADRQNLGAALDDLATALDQIKTFIASNRALIKTNVTRLAAITGTLVKERASLAEALDDAPLAADNLLGAYDPRSHTLDGRANLQEFSVGPATSVITGTGTTAEILFQVPSSELGSLPPLPFPVTGPVYGTPHGPSANPGGH